MKTFIEKLIQLADGLDGLGLHKDADKLDQIIAKAAAGDEFEDYLKLFDEPVGLEIQEEKGPGGEKVIIEEPEVHTPLEEEEAPLSKEKTGPSRLDMIKRRHDLMKLKNKIKQEEENEYLDKMEEEIDAEESARKEDMDDKGLVECKSCGTAVAPGQSHYPGHDAENGPAHSPEAEPEEESFEDEDEAVNEADDGLIDQLKGILKGAPDLASKLLQLVKDNPELLELLAL